MGNLLSGDSKCTGDFGIGNVANPPKQSGGSGAMSSTNKPNGSVHWRTDDDTLPEVLHNSAVEKIALGGQCLECRMDDLVANQANIFTTYLPRGAIITGASRRFTLKPASVLGTVVTGITVAGDQILASAGENEEAIVNDTLTAHNLTATSADLKQSQGAKVIITVTSDNADMTDGTDPMFYIYYDEN